MVPVFDKDLNVSVGNVVLGKLIRPNTKIKRNYDLLTHDIAVIEIDLDKLNQIQKKDYKAQIPSPYPEVKRDLSVFIPKNISWSDIEKTVLNTSNLVSKVEVWDIYEKNDKTSLTFSFVLRSYEKTFEDLEITSVYNKIIQELNKKGVELTTAVN